MLHCNVILILESIVEILATLAQKSNKHSPHYGCISRSLNKRIVHRFVPSIAATAGSPADGDSFSGVRSQMRLWATKNFDALFIMKSAHFLFVDSAPRFGGWFHG